MPVISRMVMLCLCLLVSGHAAAIDVADAAVQAFLKANAKTKGFDRGFAEASLRGAHWLPSVVEAMQRPAEAKPWHRYRPIFLTDERIKAGRNYLETHQAAFAATEQSLGVDQAMIAAIIGVETFYGRNAGKYVVLDALTTLAFRYPKRAEFFQRELVEFLILAQEQGFDPKALRGSYAGAMGLGQFMPSSYRAYAVDGDGDARVDIWENPRDAIQSVANYFLEHGWQAGAPVALPVTAPAGWRWQAPKDYQPNVVVADLRAQGFSVPAELLGDERVALIGLEGERGMEYWIGFKNFYVITRYNRSPLYAMAVLQLAQALGLP